MEDHTNNVSVQFGSVRRYFPDSNHVFFHSGSHGPQGFAGEGKNRLPVSVLLSILVTLDNLCDMMSLTIIQVLPL